MHRPIFLGTRAELGISRRYLHTSFTAKKSAPVNCRLFSPRPSCRRKRDRCASRRKSGSPGLCHTASASRRDRRSFDDRLSAIACPAACSPSTRRKVAVCARPCRQKEHAVCNIRTRSSFSINLSSYMPPARKGMAVLGPGGFTPSDGCTFMIRIDFGGIPSLGKAYISVRSRRASRGESHSPDRSNGAT